MGLFSVGVHHITDNSAVAWWDIELFTGQNGRPWRKINYKYQWSWKQFLDRLLRNSSWHFNILKNSFCNFLLNFTYSPHLSFTFFIKVKAKFVRHKIPKNKQCSAFRYTADDADMQQLRDTCWFLILERDYYQEGIPHVFTCWSISPKRQNICTLLHRSLFTLVFYQNKYTSGYNPT